MEIPTGADDRTVEPAHEQMMKRRGRQHHADAGLVSRDVIGERSTCSRLGPHEDDGARRPTKHGFVFWTDVRVAARHIDVAHHEREGLVGPLLALAEPPHRLHGGRVAAELIPPEALDGDDVSLHDQRCHRVVLVEHAEGFGREDAAIGSAQLGTRPAGEAGDGLRVVAAIGGVLVLGPAGVAYGKASHRGVVPIVGNALDDGVARTAVRSQSRWGKRSILVIRTRSAALKSPCSAATSSGIRPKRARSYISADMANRPAVGRGLHSMSTKPSSVRRKSSEM